MRTQLTQEKVQKSMSTTLPRRSASVSGVVFSHPSMPVKPGAGERSLTGKTCPPAFDEEVAGAGLLTTVKSTAAAITRATVTRAVRYRFTLVHQHSTGSVLRDHYEPCPVC